MIGLLLKYKKKKMSKLNFYLLKKWIEGLDSGHTFIPIKNKQINKHVLLILIHKIRNEFLVKVLYQLKILK